MKNKDKLTKEMTIGEIMEKSPDSIEKLLNLGLGCCGCYFASMETLEQGCSAHGLDVQEVLEELNKS